MQSLVSQSPPNPAVNRALRNKAAQRPVTSTLGPLEKPKMNLEVIFFRAFLVVSVSSLLGFFGLSTYYSNAAAGWGEIAEQNFKMALERERDCEEDKKREHITSSCKMAESWTKTFRESRSITENLAKKSDIFFNLSYLVPLICVFLFYGGRWSILGRLKPLWPLTKQSKI